MTSVASPCINVCQINETSGYCRGCYRTLDEIAGWWDMSQEEQRALLAVLEKREIEVLEA